MPIPSLPPPDDASELRERRNAIRRSLSRVNTAGVAVVLITIGLAIAAAIAAVRAGRQAELTQAANQRAQDQLWNSYLAQARAGRLSGLVGRKSAGLQAIAAAAAIRPSVELRNEAVAHVALFDLEPTDRSWPHVARQGHRAVDAKFEQSLESDGTGTARIRRIADPANLNPHPNLHPNPATNFVRLPSTNGPVSWARFSPDSQTLALLHQNRTLAVWDLSAQTNLYSHPAISWVDLSPDGSRLVAGTGPDGSEVRILDTASGAARVRFKAGRGASRAVFDPAGTHVALALPGGIEVWDWQKPERLDFLETEQSARSLAWGGELLAAGDRTGDVYVWNRITRRSRRIPAHQNYVNHVFFSPAGDVLYTASYDGSAKVWNPRSGRMLLTTSQGFAVQSSPDGRQVLFYDQAGWRVWNVSAPDGLSTLNCVSGVEPLVWHADFSPDGRWLTATKPDGVCVFAASSGARAHFLPVNQARTAYFIDGGSNLLTTSTRRVALWPIESAAALSPADHPQFHTGPRALLPLTNISHLESGTLSADRRKLVLPVGPSAAAVLDLDTRQETLRLTNAILPKLSALSPDGRWIATGTFHGRGTVIWDAATGRVHHEFRDGNSSAYFSPDGRQLVAAGSSSYRIHEVGTWRMLREISTDSGSDLPNLAAFSRDGSLLATVKEMTRVELIHPQTGGTVVSLIPPDPQVVTWMTFAPQDERLAVATGRDFVQLWDFARLRKMLAPLGLDWDANAPVVGTPASTTTTARPAGTALPRLLAGLAMGVLVAIACTAFIRHRQGRLLATYLELDERAEDQRRQLTRIQSEVVHAQKMKALGTLAAGIAHDFNNLLSVIRMSNQLNGEALPDRPDLAENAAEIEQAVQQGKKLVRSMLGYSREDPDEARPFAIPELVEDTVGLLSKQFLGGIALTLELDQRMPYSGSSRSRLEQILLNLIVNAVEAMAGRGALRISVRPCPILPDRLVLAPRPAAAFSELTVEDAGPGIPPKILPRIFEPFFTTKHRGVERGTGLGLSTVYAAAEQDGLGLAVESPATGGSRFRVFIPVVPPGSDCRPNSLPSSDHERTRPR